MSEFDTRVDIKVFAFSLEGIPSAVLRIIFKGMASVSFCFSQVAIAQCLIDFEKEGYKLNEELKSQFLRNLDKIIITDFSDIESVTFNPFISLTLALVVEDLLKSNFLDYDLAQQYEYFKHSGYYEYCIPGKNTILINENLAFPIDMSAFYIKSNPCEVGIFYSKKQTAALIPKFPKRELKRRIIRSSLTDDSLEGPEFLDEFSSRLFGFLFCLKWLHTQA